MSSDASPTPIFAATRPTSVRHSVLAVATLMSVLLYLDRFVVSIAAEYIREDLRMTQTQMAWFMSAFFWSYALCQVPAGWFGDRFGTRTVLTIYILAWSIFTGLMGFAHSVWLMVALRLACGCSQAGAYPTVVGLIRQWFPISFRGTASSIVALGGRFGAVLAPVLTAWLIVAFVSDQSAPKLGNRDILDGDAFLARFDIDPSSGETLSSGQQASDLPVKVLTRKEELNRQRRLFIERFQSQLSVEQLNQLKSWAREATENVNRRKASSSGVSDDRHEIKSLSDFIDLVNQRLTARDFIDFDAIPVKLTDRGDTLLTKKRRGTSLTEDETILLNRAVLETLFRTDIRKSLGDGWRPTVIVYGLAGIFVAIAFYFIVRNSPRQHPKCNDQERRLVDGAAGGAATNADIQTPPFPWRTILTDLSLWGNSLCQFTTNVGWFFVVSYLPRYLDEVHAVPLVLQGYMTGLTSGVGIIFLFAGGRCTDWAVGKIGLKWGRRVPLAASRFVGAAGCFFCVLLGILVEPGPNKAWLPWAYVIGLSLAASATDFGSPAIWSYAQDVGGKYTASILGWGNMWGNLGAAVSPLIYNSCLGEHPSVTQWNLVFGVCGGAFVLSGLFAVLLDASKKITVDSFAESIRSSEIS